MWFFNRLANGPFYHPYAPKSVLAVLWFGLIVYVVLLWDLGQVAFVIGLMLLSWIALSKR